MDRASPASGLCGFSFRNAMGFSDQWVSLDPTKLVSVLVGKNNSGKSTVLRMLGRMHGQNLVVESGSRDCRQGKVTEFRMRAKVSADVIQSTFTGNVSTGEIHPYRSYQEYGLKYAGQTLEWTIGGGVPKPRDASISEPGIHPPFSRLKERHTLLPALASAVPVAKRRVISLGAERDIRPEPKSAVEDMRPNGEGATNLLRYYLTRKGVRHGLVEVDLLHFLNTVCRPDTEFDRISCLEDDSVWEVYLHEKGHGAFPVSDMGSGLKTILLLGILLVVGPEFGSYELKNTFLALEEPENNLHPGQIRRLLHYINAVVRRDGMFLGVATHSGVVIDFFARDENCAMYHTSKGEDGCCLNPIVDYSTRRDLVEDIGIRASEALQSNGIIWCEGPSDRLLVLGWLEKFGRRGYVEGRDFSIMFYGGRLLSWLSGDAPERVEEAISILGINRNMAILIDSDRREEGADINETKERMVRECNEMGGYSWVTWGREIENYIAPSLLAKVVEIETDPEVSRYGSVFESLEAAGSSGWSAKKPELAGLVRSAMLDEKESDVVGDLQERLSSLEDAIASWNEGCW